MKITDIRVAAPETDPQWQPCNPHAHNACLTRFPRNRTITQVIFY